MATTRIKDLSKTATTVASDANIVIDGSSNGTQKITRDNFRQDTADAFVAAPSTYKLAPLNGVNKIDATYLPTSSDTPKGEWNASSNSPALADGSGVAGDYYDVTTAGTANLGSGPIYFTVGDVIKYNGSTWFKIDSVANILDGSATAADGRSALSVNSKDEDAQANGTKVTAPALYFNGTTSVVTVADDDKLSFTDGVDDLPFSIGFKCKVDFSASGTNVMFGKYGLSAATREWWFYYTSSLLYFSIVDSSGRESFARWDVSNISGKTAHILMTFDGAGPNSSNAFTAAANGMNLYVNGVLQTPQGTYNDPSYTGMANTSQALWFGKSSSSFGVGHYSAFVFYNMSLSASQATVAKNGDLGFADEFGGPLGGTYTSNFTGSTNGWTAVNGNIAHSTSIGGESNALRLTLDGTTGGHYLQKTGVFTRGKRYRVKGRYYVPTNSHVDGIYFVIGTSGVVEVVRAAAPTLDSWIDFSVEVVANATADTDRLLVYALDGNSTTITDPGADDVIYILDLVVTEIGTLADFRAERYDTSTNKLYDISDNAFVGTGTSVTLTGREVPVYETGTWTPSLYFSVTSAATYSVQDGYYSRIGDTVYIRGSITLSGIGASSGAVSVAGLPFQPSGNGASSSVMPVHMTSALNLTSSPTGLVGDGVSQIQLYDAGATGQTALDETNFGASTVLKIAGTYKIQ